MTEREYLMNREIGCIAYNIIKCVQNNQDVRDNPTRYITRINKNDDLLNECLNRLGIIQGMVK